MPGSSFVRAFVHTIFTISPYYQHKIIKKRTQIIPIIQYQVTGMRQCIGDDAGVLRSIFLQCLEYYLNEVKRGKERLKNEVRKDVDKENGG